jgi:hypothetical protein
VDFIRNAVIAASAHALYMKAMIRDIDTILVEYLAATQANELAWFGV